MTGYISYVPPQLNGFNMLAYWETRSLGDDLWWIWLELVDGMLNPLGATIPHLIQLDNTAPEATIHIDSGGDCKDFAKGTPVDGHFVARDLNFGVFSLRTLPASQGPPNPTPSSGISQTATAPGDPWNLATGGMNPCGYVVLLQVWDRAIVNSQPGVHNYNENDVGFCLRAS